MTQPAGRSVCLGLFVVGQLLFLFGSNLLELIHDFRADLTATFGPELESIVPGWTREEGVAWESARTLRDLTYRWAELTGQSQSWSLFAPGIGAECVFPAVQRRFDDDPDSASAIAANLFPLAAADTLGALTLNAVPFLHKNSVMPPAADEWLSDNEPVNIHAFLRLGHFRLRRFESGLTLDLSDEPGESTQVRAGRWRQEIEKFVKKKSAKILAYLRWRGQRDRTTGSEPRQIILLMRRYHINRPESPEVWQGPFIQAVARWQPAATWSAAYGPVEIFNPVTKRFEGVVK